MAHKVPNRTQSLVHTGVLCKQKLFDDDGGGNGGVDDDDTKSLLSRVGPRPQRDLGTPG